MFDLIIRLYGILKDYGMSHVIMAPARRIMVILTSRFLPAYLKKHPVRDYNQPFREGLIVSLTSFPARIEGVWLVIECLKRQSVLPERIILWLSKDQFPSMESLPESLVEEQDSLFEIRMVDGDIRSYKKFFYTMKEYPQHSFITFDDDVYYDRNAIKRLLEIADKNNGAIVTNHSKRIAFDEYGEVLTYNQWGDIDHPYANEDRVQIGIGGVFYPCGSLHPLVLRDDIFLKVAPMADDLWLNCMARLNGTTIIQSCKYYLSLPVKTDSPSLTKINNGQNMNDVQLGNIREWLNEAGVSDVYKKF